MGGMMGMEDKLKGGRLKGTGGRNRGGTNLQEYGYTTEAHTTS